MNSSPLQVSGVPPGRLRWALAVVVAVLVAVNVIDVRVAHASLVLGPAGAAGLLAVARWAGLSWRELGLGSGTWRRGLVWAFGAIGAAAVVFAAGAALPLTRSAFRDARYHLNWEHALLTAFLLIPLGTVLFEEVAFRGVLWGLLRRGHGTWVATVVSSALFGVWHVLPSLSLATNNQAIGSAVGKGTSGEAISVLGTVLFTGLAGVVFCELRRRSGSLLASAGLHWAVNGLGVLAAASVWAWGSR
jgi:membrane protease YdiL (CAAX protease family)